MNKYLLIMQKQYTKLLFIIVSLLLFFSTSSCTQDTDKWETTDKFYFRLNFGSENKTRSTITSPLDVRVILSRPNGEIVNNLYYEYKRDQSLIVMEPIPQGIYTLHILAFDPSLSQNGLRIQEKPTNLNQQWFWFEQSTTPILESESLLYAKKEFSVATDAPINQSVTLNYLLSAININRSVESEYLRNSIQSIDLSLYYDALFYNGMTIDGVYNGSAEAPVHKYVFNELNTCYVMPQIKKEPTQVSLTINTCNHSGMTFQLTQNTDLNLEPGHKAEVSLDFSAHPDSKIGMLYITKEVYDQTKQNLILQDNESKNVYFNESMRSFRIKELLQIRKENNNMLRSRFYSPSCIRNVTLWAKSPKHSEKILIAHYDSIPAFCDAVFPIPSYTKSMDFYTESKAIVKLSSSEIIDLYNSEITINSPDPFWQKVKEIKANWYIKFSAYGGNPDLQNGGPSGNWMGIRPVHIREAIALWINIGYMVAQKSFADHLQTFQGKLYGNGGPTDIINVNTLVPRIESHSGFDIGLVYDGNGVIGLGGGNIWGVHQFSFFHHYDDQYACNTIFHELGHCLGYSHDSSMTYGVWANGCANVYYVNNINSFPVNSWTTLKSRTNTHKY